MQMRIPRAMLGGGAGCVLLLAGCTMSTGLGGGLGGGFGGCDSHGQCLPSGPQLEPAGFSFLRGDTVMMSAQTAAGYATATWKISGGARFIDKGTLTDQLAGTGIVRVKMLAAGTMKIDVSTDEGYQIADTYAVADSSAISTLRFTYWGHPASTIDVPQSREVFVYCEALDAASRLYIARPTSFASSDSAVATISADSGTRACAGVVRTNKAGQAILTASFLGVAAALQVNVTP